MKRTVVLALIALVFTFNLSIAQNKPKPVFVTQIAHDNYLQFVPDGVLTKEELSRIVFYDTTTVPQANQDWASSSGLVGWFPISANISANRSEPFGNPNREFPWLTGGLDNSNNGSSFKGYIPPVGKDAHAMPIRGTWEVLSRTNGTFEDKYIYATDNYPSMVGRYPLGAKLVEFLLVKDFEGWSHTFEARVMRKVKENDLWDTAGNWEFKVYRAVRDSGHLMELMWDVSNSQYHELLVRHYQDSKFPTEELKNKHPVRVFESVAVVDNLPESSKTVLKAVHHRRFQDVTDIPWLETTNGARAFAGRGGVFPNAYQGNHFHSKNCANCHSTVLKHAGDMELGRDWYLRVRGVDGIFSLPIIDDSSVDRQDVRTHGRSMLWNQKLVKAGLLVGEGRK